MSRRAKNKQIRNTLCWWITLHSGWLTWLWNGGFWRKGGCTWESILYAVRNTHFIQTEKYGMLSHFWSASSVRKTTLLLFPFQSPCWFWANAQIPDLWASSRQFRARRRLPSGSRHLRRRGEQVWTAPAQVQILRGHGHSLRNAQGTSRRFVKRHAPPTTALSSNGCMPPSRSTIAYIFLIFFFIFFQLLGGGHGENYTRFQSPVALTHYQCLSFDEEHWLKLIISVFSEAQGRRLPHRSRAKATHAVKYPARAHHQPLKRKLKSFSRNTPERKTMTRTVGFVFLWSPRRTFAAFEFYSHNYDVLMWPKHAVALFICLIGFA